jgi:hypothetical protein
MICVIMNLLSAICYYIIIMICVISVDRGLSGMRVEDLFLHFDTHLGAFLSLLSRRNRMILSYD